MNEEELLLHYGVKGMKWGVRRSRTSKGSATKRISESAKDYGKTYKKTVKDSFVNSKSQTKAELQLLKEKPRTALYRNKEDLKRLNQLTAENIAAKKERKAKSAPKIKERTESVTAKTKYGDTVTLAGEPTPKFTKFLASRFKGVRENVEKSDHFQLKDPNGKRVGEMQLYQESKDSVNVVWVGVDSSARGNGYAQAAMQAAVSHAKKKGLSKVTLEVPGNSPDAKHIYEKLGFKDTGVVDDDAGSMDVWGGLTHMELNLKR